MEAFTYIDIYMILFLTLYYKLLELFVFIVYRLTRHSADTS